VHLIENVKSVAAENYGVVLDSATTQLEVSYRATLFD
jgi:hypothetical protein